MENEEWKKTFYPELFSMHDGSFLCTGISLPLRLLKFWENRFWSGTSVGANYREANQGRSRAEFIAKMGDCLKELSETEYWLDLLAEEKLGEKADLAGLKQETKELISIFTTIIKNTKRSIS